jgi:hypothetical protein
MARRSSFTAPHTIDVQGVLGTFKVPTAELTVEYILTYASLDASQAAYGQLLDLLLPFREVFEVKGLSFDHLLQRDLDDHRVSNEMVPYLLGDGDPDPRFFPPIVAVIVPMKNGVMANRYPKSSSFTKPEDGVKLNTQKFGDVFSIKREEGEGKELARSPVDLTIHPANAKLVIVDGQHRAMAMLATYRSAYKKWSGSQFQYFYESTNSPEASDKAPTFGSINLPVCLVYFPELTEHSHTAPRGIDLIKACRKLFLDVNRNARQPSEARQILLDDTDLVAFFTRNVFDTFQQSTKSGTAQLHHTEYDNPRDRVPISRPFALTDVYAIYAVIYNTLLLDNDRIRKPTAGAGKSSPNYPRLRRELEVNDVFTEDDLDKLEFRIEDIQQDDYPRQLEEPLRKCFVDGWGAVIVNTFNNFYPFVKHINAVDAVISENEPYTGPNSMAKSALMEGQGLRHALEKQQESNKKRRKKERSSEQTAAEKAWSALTKLENEFEIRRAKMYLELKKNPDVDQVKQVGQLFNTFRTTAFQLGLFMAFACLKERLGLDNEQFVEQAKRWIERLNKQFKTSSGVKMVLFDPYNQASLRSIYKPSGGITVADWIFFRYVILELLSPGSSKEKAVINEAKLGWRNRLFSLLYERKLKELSSEDQKIDVKQISLRVITDAYKQSLNVDKETLKKDLEESLKDADRTNNLQMPESAEVELVDGGA